MIRFKPIAITVVIMCSMFIMVNSTQAQINIIDMYVLSEVYNNNGWFCHYAYVDTDKPFEVVDWYIGDPEDGDNFPYVGATQGDGVKTRAYFYPDVSDCPGHIKGKEYQIAAKVWYTDDDGNGSSDYDTRDFTVFRTISTYEVEDPPKKVSTVSGYAELTRQYYTGDAIKIDCYVFAYNNADNPRGLTRAWSRFKHDLTGKQTIEREHPTGRFGIEPQPIGGEHGTYSRADILPHTDIDVRNNSYRSLAYVRLVVNSGGFEDNYFVGNPETFNHKDRPYDAPDDDE